ncbi:MAG: L-threonylcarbamoyladenylate synthase [Porphyromonadaceae bacterium]|nr:L-threonylcarbamoyladenylate synthase [Porphyromonadaceae bacterium]
MHIKIYEQNPNERLIRKAVEVLKNGGVIIYPTDTVYAFGCNIFNQKAIERICKIKHLDINKSRMAIVCQDLSNISNYAKISTDVFKLLKKNLPGAFTFILNGSKNLPSVLKDKKTIGIRMPNNNIALEIVRMLGNPIFTSSVIEADDVTEYETDPELLIEKYEDMVDLIIDGGFGYHTPSTIVDCTGEEIEIIRQGKGELE